MRGVTGKWKCRWDEGEEEVGTVKASEVPRGAPEDCNERCWEDDFEE